MMVEEPISPQEQSLSEIIKGKFGSSSWRVQARSCATRGWRGGGKTVEVTREGMCFHFFYIIMNFLNIFTHIIRECQVDLFRLVNRVRILFYSSNSTLRIKIFR